ncbi:hypothetical protein CQY20_22230 [Mycolicibacterium agri]|uniref:Uncharacterized protein n=1 Tax=Mycolicibacterium agri TaxID=36811 RepID=A0A2A7MU02_MYCAG|nr:hypothetical protein [Mycolicibacterium agri]PEG35292.1 hypothetical protein CQY20_22230 [Mycolicibacterium agri]
MSIFASAAFAAGFVAVAGAKEASAETTCTVTGQYFNLHQDNGYDLVISANGSTLGPTGLARANPQTAVYGDVKGGINGRLVDFTITWSDNKGQAHFTGAVGDDGIAKGNSTGPSVPINLWNPGPWTSNEPLNCTSPEAEKAKQGPLVSAEPALAGVTFHITDRSGVASQCTYSSEGYKASFGLPANGSFDLFVPAIRLFKTRTGLIECDNGTSTPTSVFY